jgi:hypothetical protein
MECITSLFYFILWLANLIGPSQEKILKTTLEVFMYKDVLPPPLVQVHTWQGQNIGQIIMV